MGLSNNLDIFEVIKQKILCWYGYVKRMPEERLTKIIK